MSERKILLLGSGFVAGPCAEYLLRQSQNQLTIASRNIKHAEALVKQFPRAKAATLDINNEQAFGALVAAHDLVISLIPYTQHTTVIKMAIKHKKHVVTTSYVSPAMMEFDQAAKDAGVSVFNEIGLDPGIDHLYAIKTIDEVHKEGGKILSFLSYCCGLPAPENSNNPLGYKFSWSSRGVLLALRSSAKFLRDGKAVEISHADLMGSAKPIFTGYPGFSFVGYPNRDSTQYVELYNIPEAREVLRGTLRYGGFPEFVKALVEVNLLDDQEHDYLQPSAPEITWSQVLAKALGLSESLSTDNLKEVVLARTNLKGNANASSILEGFKWIGLFSDVHVHRRGTLLDTLCATLEERCQYEKGERDLVFLQHRFEVELKNGTRQTRTSTLIDFGKPTGSGPSSMATTVGVPCGIATQLILDGKITKKGVFAPMTPEINNLIIALLEKEGICMTELTF